MQEEAKRTQMHSSAAALEARAARAEQQLADAQRQVDAARSEGRQLAARLATAEARLAEAQQLQVYWQPIMRVSAATMSRVYIGLSDI